jgi:hypothetical protein
VLHGPIPTGDLRSRSETHWTLRQLLENNQVAIPQDLALEEEGLAVEWQVKAKNLIQILSKDSIRGSSADRLIASTLS